MAETKLSISRVIVKVLPFTAGIFEALPWLAQFIDFGAVGLSNLAVAYGVYALLLSFGLHPQIANFFSFWTSVLNAYLLNRFWVFNDKRKVGEHTIVKFVVIYGLNLIMGIGLLYLYIDVLHWNKYWAPLISLPITVPINYLLNRIWVFRAKQ
jgi:putative flippase GtrA